MSEAPPPTPEMISGPDLGAGFLHQLSREGQGPGTTFTYHAQDGGADAGGPPKGALDPLGFAHPPTPCMFGGPRCWHRSFRVPFEEAPKVRLAYNRNRFVLQTMLDQSLGTVPAEADLALAEVLGRIARPLAAEGIEWYVAGSMAARLLGADLSPHDVDLGVGRDGVTRLGELLALYLIEPVAITEWPGQGTVHAARAFVGTFEKGARVEWSVPSDGEPAPPFAEFSGVPGAARTETARFRQWTVRVSRPEYGIVRAAERGRADALAVHVSLARSLGPDLPLLEILLERSSLPPDRRSALVESMRG